MRYGGAVIELGILITLYKLYGTYYAGKTWGTLEFDKGTKWRMRIEDILREDNAQNG